MDWKNLLVLDFETLAIGPRPKHYPPRPVGYAWMFKGRKGYADIRAKPELLTELTHMLEDSNGVLCHNAAFDREVCEVHHIKLDRPWHCTMLAGFIADPYGPLGLKPLAEHHLGMPPEERDVVRDWLIANGKVTRTQKDWGAYISEAPTKIVGPYAIGDVERTLKLAKKWEAIFDGEAYKREQQLQDVTLDMEQHGVHIDRPLLEYDADQYFKRLDDVDKRLRKMLGDIDLDADVAVAMALQKKHQLSSPLPLTPKGAIQVNKHALMACVQNKQLLGELLMRNALATCVRTFYSGWLEQLVGDRLFFRFSQTRNYHGLGARTGRMSSSPNMMNVPSTWEILYGQLAAMGYKRAYDLPNMRKYILPDKGHVMVSCDMSQIEMRLFAHFEDGDLLDAYRKNPELDAHQATADLVGVTRKVAKTLNFAVLYGAGIGTIAEWLDCTVEEARRVKSQYMAAMPGVKALQKSIDDSIKQTGGIHTVGGRFFPPEPGKYIAGQWRTFEYKLMNYLIQGSAADQFKQAMVEYQQTPSRHGRMMFPVHDQAVLSVPKSRAKQEATMIQKVMSSAMQEDIDVKLYAEVSLGANYAEV